MSRKEKPADLPAAGQLPACLPDITQFVEFCVNGIGGAIGREIERGTRNTQIADYLRNWTPEDPMSLEYAVWLSVIYWLSGWPGVNGQASRMPGGQEPPKPEGGPSCLIV